MSNGRQYGGWDEMQRILGPIYVRYQRRAGHAEELAGFTADGTQVTEFSAGELIEKQEMLPWAKAVMEEATGIRWKLNPDGSESQLQNLESR
jgi:hypothetical protein